MSSIIEQGLGLFDVIKDRVNTINEKLKFIKHQQNGSRTRINSQKTIFKQDMEVILDILIYQSLVKIDKDRIIRIHDQL
uniref:Uncharacterized protein n=1 Tax=Physcomitrium patens TaxID=3218 RepID=A0A2K1J4V5_PHYPA|nr:hypothetical protein PHYPA_022406 [Physcomitrium patens]